jgi:hypothetical protein
MSHELILLANQSISFCWFAEFQWRFELFIEGKSREKLTTTPLTFCEC